MLSVRGIGIATGGEISMGITVIIPSRGLETLLRLCVAMATRALGFIGEPARHVVVVVDNASDHPYTPEPFASSVTVELIRFDTHHSFASACNTAARRHPNDFYLLLNNDVLIAEEALARMMAVMTRSSKIGVCGTRLLFPDHTVQHCGVMFSDKKGPYHIFRKWPNTSVSRLTREYQAVTGACMLIRQSVWDQLNGLDEVYPFGLEDIDFCLRARQQGWRIFCCNEVDSLHFESLTPGRVKMDVPSRDIFMKKWRGRYTIDGPNGHG